MKTYKDYIDKISLEDIKQHYEIENMNMQEACQYFDITQAMFIKLLRHYGFHKSKEAHTKQIKKVKKEKYGDENYNNHTKNKGLNMKFGYLREDYNKAIQAGSAKNGVPRTGLEEYLKVMFPNTTDWLHDKETKIESLGKKRPDYRSESLKLIVEFDGLPHYQKPNIIMQDKINTQLYEEAGYKVIRIPFFLQLTNAVVKELFDVEVSEELFPEGIESFSEDCTPAWFCPLGIKRCKEELIKFYEQYETNVNYLKTLPEEISGLNYLDMFN